MCPVCLATAAILAGSASGTGGLTALVALTFRRKSKREFTNPPTKENPNGRYLDRSPSSQDRPSRGMD